MTKQIKYITLSDFEFTFKDKRYIFSGGVEIKLIHSQSEGEKLQTELEAAIDYVDELKCIIGDYTVRIKMRDALEDIIIEEAINRL